MNKKTFIFLVLFIVVVFFAYQEAQKVKEPTLSVGEIQPYSTLSLTHVDSLQIAASETTLKKIKGQWEVQDGLETTVDAGKLSEFFESLRRLRAFPSTLKKESLGLSSEIPSLTFESSRLGKRTLQLSGYKTYDGKRHVLEVESGAIYVVDPSTQQLFYKKSNDFLDLKVFDEDKSSSIKTVSFFYKKTQMDFQKKDSEWFYGKKKLDQNNFGNILLGIFRFEANSIDHKLSREDMDLSEEADLRIYGKDKKNKSIFELFVKIDDQKAFIQRKGKQLIYVTNANSVEEWLLTKDSIPYEPKKEMANTKESKKKEAHGKNRD